MAQIALSNTAPETVLVGDISSSTGTIVVEAGLGSAFPPVPFRVGINREAMLVTDVTVDTFTVERGYDGTASAPHVSGDDVQHIHTATDFPFRVDDTSGLYIGQAGIDMATFAVSNVGALGLSSIGGDITNVGSITSNNGANLVLKPEGSGNSVQLSTSAGKKRIVAETDNVRFYAANGLAETLVWDEAGVEWDLQAKFNVNLQPFVGIDALVSAATKNLVLRPLDSDKAVSINNYLDDFRIVVEAGDITFYQGDGTTPTLVWNDGATEWQLDATFNASGENITGVEILASSVDEDLSLRPGNTAYAVNLEAADGSDRVTVETNDIRFFKADGLTETLKWDQAGNEWEFGAAINANTFVLFNVADPTDDAHVGDRGYNDLRYAAISGGDYLPLDGGTMAGDITMGGNDLLGVGYLQFGGDGSIRHDDGVTRMWIDDGQVSFYRPAGGAPVVSIQATIVKILETLSLETNFLTGVLDPTGDTHVGDRGYNDLRYAAIVTGGYLPLSGGVMTGDIDMAGNTLEAVDAILYLDATNTGAAAGDIYIRTDDATGTRRNRVIIDGDGNMTFYDQAGAQAMLFGTSYMQVSKSLTVGDNTLYGVADPTADTHVGDRAYNDGRYALDGTGVTNGDSHDHAGGDGASIAHTDLIGLSESQHHVKYTDAEAIAAVGTVMNGVPSGASLPLTGIAGDLFFLTVDEKLYRHNGTTWLVTTATSDLSGVITETQIDDNAITTGKLDANAVTAAKIEAETITTSEIAADTILAGNIAAGAIEASELAVGSVEADAIVAGAITTIAMTANTIDGDRIEANTLDAAKITAGTITTDRMTAGTIDADRLTANSITATEIDAATITTTQLAANLVLVAGQAISASYSAGVSGWQIQQSGTAEFNEVIVRGALIGQAGSSISADYLTAGTIDASTIFVENIDADNITAGTLSADRIAAGSLDAAKITAGTITTDRMTAGTIDADRLTALSIEAAQINAGAITTNKMTAGTIDADRLTALSIEAAQINTGAITTAKMTAGTIDADRLIADSITATEIDAGTITTTELEASLVLVAGQAISASYVVDTSGWQIAQDGSAEFNNVTVRGALIAQAGSTISADYLIAGEIDAAVIDVTNLDAGNITVGTLSADRIAAGSLDAVKITTGTITTGLMTVNTIDGDRILADSLEAVKIVAGSITTDRMTANTIAGDRIEAGSLEAVKIVAGSMTTTQFSSDTISGTIISTETLNADRLVAGSIDTDRMSAGTINADRLTAGSITATELAAGSITAGKLAVQTMSNNLMPNPDFVWDSIGGTDDPHDYSTTYGGAWSAGTSRLTGGVRSARYTFGTGGPGDTWTVLGGAGQLGKFPAQEGDKFYLSMWVRTVATAPLASPYNAYQIGYRQAGGTFIGADQPGSATLSTSWQKIDVTGIAPPNTTYFQVLLNHEYTGSETGTETIEYSNVVLERVSPTVLIDNGAITAAKIATGTITANEIDTDTITADRWVGDLTLVSGQVISGSYDADTSGWKIDQSGTAEFNEVIVRGALIGQAGSSISADYLTAGEIDADVIDVTNLNATNITSGAIHADRLSATDLNANNITSGAIHADRIATTALDADNINAGEISASRIKAGTIGAVTINLANSSNSQITSNNTSDWYIQGDGYAKFTNVDITGTLRTSSVLGWLTTGSGGGFRTGGVGTARVELDDNEPQFVRFYNTSGSKIADVGYDSEYVTMSVEAFNASLYLYTNHTAALWGFNGSNLGTGTSVTTILGSRIDMYYAGTRHFRIDSTGCQLQHAGATKLHSDASGIKVTGRMDYTSYIWGPQYAASAGGNVASNPFRLWGNAGYGMSFPGSGFTSIAAGSAAVISGNGSNQLYLGGMYPAAGTGRVEYVGSRIYYTTSSRRYKDNIAAATVDPDTLLRWEPQTFTFKGAPETGTHLWYIAEDIEDVSGPVFVKYDEDGKVANTDDHAMFAVLVEKVKAQHAEIVELIDEVGTLKEQVSELIAAQKG